MFPYLKRISDFIKDCETIDTELAHKTTGEYEFVSLYKPHHRKEREACDGNCGKCKEMPTVVTWLIRNVNAANWGCDLPSGIGNVAFSEVRAWCHSLCDALYDVLKPLEDSDLIIGLEYYLETRKGFGPDNKNHFRVDVMIGGYGLKYGEPEGRLLVIEQKQYNNVAWKKGGRELTWFLGSQKGNAESPCKQVQFYCDNIAATQKKKNGSSFTIYPCVFMHNLQKEAINAEAYEELDANQTDGLLLDNGTLFQGNPIDIFIRCTKDNSDPYRTFRSHIREIFNYNGNTEVDALNIFRNLKKSYPRLSPDELGAILTCKDEDFETRIRSILRPDQFFAMYGYEENRDWDNYIKNHIDFASFLRLQTNRDYWGPLKYGIIDLIEGGPGSGKTILAMLILRYCLLRKLKVLYVYAGSAPINRIFGQLCASPTFDHYLQNEQFKSICIQDLLKYPDYDVYLIDDAHIDKETYGEKYADQNNAGILRDLKKAKKLIFLLYDRHQITWDFPYNSDGSKEKEYYDMLDELSNEGTDKRAFRDVNVFKLWSMYRCNRIEGYLTYIEIMLGIRPHDPKKGIDLFDFDVRFPDIEAVKKLAAGISQNNDLLVLSESEDETTLTDILGRSARIYKGKNGLMQPIAENSTINVGNALKVRGIEADRVLVILDDRIRYQKGTVSGDTDLKNRYRILLTRGLKECHIYVMNEKLREYMITAANLKNKG